MLSPNCQIYKPMILSINRNNKTSNNNKINCKIHNKKSNKNSVFLSWETFPPIVMTKHTKKKHWLIYSYKIFRALDSFLPSCILDHFLSVLGFILKKYNTIINLNGCAYLILLLNITKNEKNKPPYWKISACHSEKKIVKIMSKIKCAWDWKKKK